MAPVGAGGEVGERYIVSSGADGRKCKETA